MIIKSDVHELSDINGGLAVQHKSHTRLLMYAERILSVMYTFAGIIVHVQVEDSCLWLHFTLG